MKEMQKNETVNNSISDPQDLMEQGGMEGKKETEINSISAPEDHEKKNDEKEDSQEVMDQEEIQENEIDSSLSTQVPNHNMHLMYASSQ